MPGLVAHACTPSSLVVGAGGLPGVLGWPRLHSEFQTKLDYSVRLQTNKQANTQTEIGTGDNLMAAYLSSMLEAGFDSQHS